MSDRDYVLTAVRQVNPRPAGAVPREGEWSTAELLLQIELRSGSMETIERRPEPRAPIQAPRRRPTWRAAAVAVVVVVLAGVALFAFVGGSDEPDAANPASAMATVDQFIDRYEAGDVDGYQALMTPDVLFSCDGCGAGDFAPDSYYDYPGFELADSDARDSRLLYVTQGSLGETCRADGPTVTCEMAKTSAVGFRSEAGTLVPDRYTHIFTVEDGLITAFKWIGNDAEAYDFSKIGEYERWLAANYPEDHAELFLFGTMLLNDADQTERHRALFAEWLDSTG